MVLCSFSVFTNGAKRRIARLRRLGTVGICPFQFNLQLGIHLFSSYHIFAESAMDLLRFILTNEKPWAKSKNCVKSVQRGTALCKVFEKLW